MSYSPRLKILFLAADPTRASRGPGNTSVLNFDQEFREIQHSIQLGKYRDQIDLESSLAVTTQDFLDALNKHRPRVVHFSGHGSRCDGIVLVGEQGKPETVGSTFLSRVFTTLSSTVGLVVLNSCYSGLQAQAIANAVAVTIGTVGTLSDASAIAFSRALYSAISNGASVGHSFQQAEAVLDSVRREERPAMLVRPNLDACSLTLTRTPDAGTYEPLALTLGRAAKEYFDADRPYLNVLEKADAYFKAISRSSSKMQLQLPITESLSAGLKKLEALLGEEISKIEEFLRHLDGIGRRWSSFLSDNAVSKLTQLEQVLSEAKDQIQQTSIPIKRAAEEICNDLQDIERNSRVIQEKLSGLTGLLSTMQSYLQGILESTSLYYNQLIEFLPGDVLRRGLIHPVGRLLCSEDDSGGE